MSQFSTSSIIDNLHKEIQKKKCASPEKSYVAKLFQEGEDKVLKKIGEESTEVILASKGNQKSCIVHEMADLLFHSLVMLEMKEIHYKEVLQELQNRLGVSGIEEKKRRSLDKRQP